ncbi:HEAT repeat domain-containing protein [Argonema antarcticum]|uniref:HEAT repeat domain-containing protein n=1 Tax=Argonema antarcticum TaxID=2942763 RepID=UPI0020130084|nr:HEAT repeat domain-containing protein [Argonema antarcticum]MCL1475535.1 HEAT repeat domain-containing protein [Argonema antarcticum A004/B2]
MRQLAKYGIALFVLGCLLTVFFPSCSGKVVCEAFFGGDKINALIGQLQGQCCIYEADAYGGCEKKSKPYIPLLKYQCVSWAADCLGAMGLQAKEAVPALIRTLERGPNNYDTGDGIIPTRNDIMLALGRTGDPRAVKPLIRALQEAQPLDAWVYAQPSGKPYGQTAAIEALGLLGPLAQEAVPYIIPFLKNSRDYRFRSAAKALGQIGDPKAIPALIEALNHPTDAASVISALEAFGPLADEAVPALIKMIESSTNVSEGLTAARAIGKIRGQAAIPKIAIMYEQKFIEFPKELREIFRDYGYKGDFVYATYEKERYYITLTNSENLYVQLDRSTSNPTLTSGQVWIEKDGKKISIQKFSTFKEMREIIKKS